MDVNPVRLGGSAERQKSFLVRYNIKLFPHKAVGVLD
jgi:hypothetical protein